MAMDIAIGFHHRPELSRYELHLDGEIVGVAEYALQLNREPPRILFTHTLVEPEHRGMGLGERLVHFALEDQRTHGRVLVVPRCWFVADYIRAHPQYLDLVDEELQPLLRT